MIVSQNSWHYKTMRWCWNFAGGSFKPPSSLCTYFWSFVGGLIRVAFGSVMVVFLLTIIPILLWSAFVNGSMLAKCFLTVLGIVLGVCFVIFMGQFGIGRLSEVKHRMERRQELGRPPATTMQMIMATFYAFKNKVCPMIKYTNE